MCLPFDITGLIKKINNTGTELGTYIKSMSSINGFWAIGEQKKVRCVKKKTYAKTASLVLQGLPAVIFSGFSSKRLQRVEGALYVCGANLSRSNYLQRIQLHKLSIINTITTKVGGNSLVTNLTPFSFSSGGGGGGEGGKKEKRRKKKTTPKECFIVLKFPSPFALPIAEINTYLVCDNQANCRH